MWEHKNNDFENNIYSSYSYEDESEKLRKKYMDKAEKKGFDIIEWVSAFVALITSQKNSKTIGRFKSEADNYFDKY